MLIVWADVVVFVPDVNIIVTVTLNVAMRLILIEVEFGWWWWWWWGGWCPKSFSCQTQLS